MMNQEQITAIVDELIHASEVYYSGQDPIMSDEDFDEKQNYLESIIEQITDNELYKRAEAVLERGGVDLGAEISVVSEVKHTNPMLSLAKAKTEEEVNKYLVSTEANGATAFKLQLKLDGFALSAQYKNGKIVQLATRGDGEVGENISYLLSANKVSILGLPRSIDHLESIELRGELYFSDEQFAKVDNARFEATGTNFKVARNAVVGLMKKAEAGVDYPVEFSFACYGSYSNGKPIELETISADTLINVDQLTLDQIADAANTIDPQNSVPTYSDDTEIDFHNIPTAAKTYEAIMSFGALREKFTVPTDGVVVKPVNDSEMLSKLGNTSHHPVSQIAFKYPAPVVTTEILKITYTVGKTGKVTPRAFFTKTNVLGSIIEYATLHNFAWMDERDVREGSTISLTKAGDVIPYVKGVIFNPENSEKFKVPIVCPTCESVLVSEDGTWPPKTLRCKNLYCGSREVFALNHAVSKECLDIDGMSETTIDYLVENGILNTLSDLYNLTLEQLEPSTFGYSKDGNPRRLGEKRAQNILDHIEKSKQHPLVKILQALSIQSLGNRASKSLVAHFGSIEAIQNATASEIAVIDKMGTVKSQLIVDGLKHRAQDIDRMREAGVLFTVPSNTTDVDLTGKSFAISGPVPQPYANRNAWVEFIEASGGKFDSAPKSTTSYMVAEENGSSSKVKKAKQLGIPFITAEEFTEMFAS